MFGLLDNNFGSKKDLGSVTLNTILPKMKSRFDAVKEMLLNYHVVC